MTVHRLDPPSAGNVLRTRLETLARDNRSQLEKCRRDLKRVPYTGFVALGVLPLTWFFGVLGLLIGVFGTLGIVGTSFYIVKGHIDDYAREVEDLERRLAKLED